ncbi:SCO family protein [candidate division GN15 bacterium]|nr:SCO family protein [candidate division GN15 bacterium]
MKQAQHKNGLISPGISLLSMFAAVLLLVGAPVAQQVQENPKDFEGMGVNEHLGEQIPLDLTFTDHTGQQVKLEKYFNQGKPVILTLVYYNCPMLCNLILNGVTEGMAGLDFDAGQDYEVVTISFNPRETAELAAAKRKNYLQELGRPDAPDGWTFHVSPDEQVKQLADAVGFEYAWNDERQEYGHPSAIFVLTEDGRISRYLYGISFQPRDLRLSLLEASEGKIGNTLDKLILFCFHYDPDARGYVVFAGNVMRLGGVVTLFALGGLIGILWYRERRKRRNSNKQDEPAQVVSQ